MHWPNQQDPGKKSWATWRRYLKKFLDVNNKLQPQLLPTIWLNSKHKQYNWYYHQGLDKLFQKANNNKWNYYVKVVQRDRRQRFPMYYYQGVFNSLPHGATPATTIFKGPNMVQFTGTMPQTHSLSSNPPVNNMSSFRHLLSLRHQHILSDITHLEHIPHIINCIKNGTCAVVTDGSYYDSTSQAAASFIIGNEAEHRHIIGRCHVVGPTSSFSSYRAELAGLHGGLVFILRLCEIYQINSGRIYHVTIKEL